MNAQCSANFNSPLSVCIGESFDVTNNTTGAIYEWDFCAGDLENVPVIDPNEIPSNVFNKPSNLTMVLEGGNWYGFVVDRFDNKNITRLDFGSDPANTPTVVSLGNFNNSFSQAIDIEFFKENNKWYALLIDLSSNKLYRFIFNTITNLTPTLESLDTFNTLNLLSAPVDVEILSETNNILALITNYNGSKITQVSFGSSITNLPTTDPLKTKSIVINTATTFQGIAALKICNIWNVLAASTTNNKVFSLKYTNGFNDLSIDPDVSEVVPSGISMSRPMGIDLVNDNNTVYAFVQSDGGDLYRLTNPEGINPTGTALANYSGSLSQAVKLVKSGSNWLAFLVNFSSSNIKRLKFPFTCSSNKPVSFDQNPTDLSYGQSGLYNISLNVYDNSGNVLSQSKVINVTTSVAPIIEMLSASSWCLSSPSTFEAIAEDPAIITSYSWDFGDGNTAAGQQVNYQYTTSATYEVLLRVSDLNGCNNQVKKGIEIFNPPSASFTLPSGLICTNNEFTFVNSTIDNFDGNLSYQWLVNETPESTDRDFVYTFTSGGDKDIKLVASIPGCVNALTQTLNDVQAGPTVGFSQAGQCEDDQIVFTNTSSGDIAGYLWDFGDGQTSGTRDASIVYSNPAHYVVSLQTTGTNGCVSSTSKTIPVYSKPQPDFSLDLPPFSCAGSPSQFNDLTPAPTDSNITSWSWSFGDAANGTAAIKNPAYTYSLAGPYSVSLTTTTNFGCSASIVEPVQIANPPIAGFNVSPSCLNQPTYFTDASTGTNKSWLWKIGNSSYSLQNPAHVFSGIGNFTAQLTVTGSNDCIAILSKPINIPVPPTLDFTVKNNCAGQVSVFDDVTTSTGDPVISRAWDFGGQGTGTGTPAQFYFQTEGAYNVKLTVTNQSGCNYSLAKNTTIVTAPVADFTSVESGPPPLTVVFTNTSSGATTFQWRFNDPEDSSSTERSPTFTYNDLGDYVTDLTATNTQGCADTKSKIIRVINPYTDIELQEFKLLKDAITGSIRPVLTIKNNSNHTVTNVNVFLDIAGNASVKEEIETSILPGTATVQILNYELLPGINIAYLCAQIHIDDDANLINNTLCVNLQSEDLIFHPYPNPNQGKFHIDWITNQGANANVLIVNSFGQKVFNAQIVAAQEGLNQLEFDVSKLSAGEYVLVFQVDGTKKSFRFTVI